MDKIAIIGLGLIGGSIGLALRQQKKPTMQVVGFDADVGVGNKAAKRGAVEKAVFRLPDAVEGASLVIIATPVLSIREVMQTIAGMVKPGCIVTDTGGTKRAVMEWAEAYLPQGVHFIGGNPLAGKDMTGIDKASPDLFKGARYVLIPGKTSGEEALHTVIGMVETLQAKPYFVDAYEHDSFVAAVTHLPLVLSAALVAANSKSPAWHEMARLASTSYENASALAEADPLNTLDMCITNREAVVHWINETIRELGRFRDLVNGASDEAGAEALGNALAKSWEARAIWHTNYLTGYTDDDPGQKRPAIAGVGEQMADIMMGSKLRERYQSFLKGDDRKEQERRQRRFRRS